MKTQIIRILLVFVSVLLGLNNTSAQQSINVSGKDISGSGGTVSYSVGQISYQTINGTNFTVSEGVQQPYEISVVTAIEEAKDINLSASIFPNPTNEYLTLEINASTTLDMHSISYQLYDLIGTLLQSEKITGNQTSINMTNLISATYFLKVTESNKDVVTFKIIKTQ